MTDNLTWIKHDGGPMPVPGDTMVAYRMRGYHCASAEATGERAGFLEWGEFGQETITEYAIVTPSPSAGARCEAAQYAAGTIDAHYRKCAIEPMTYSMANGLDAMQHTIIKYITRFRDKNGIRDLYAARHVVDMLIKHEEAKSND